MKYKVEITETLQRIVEVEADSPDEAVENVEDACNRDIVCLDAEDFKSRDAHIYKEV